MDGNKDLVELGQRVAEDGPHPHERALLEVAFLVQSDAPGAAAVLADRAAPHVLRERALSVASDVLLRTPTRLFGTPEEQVVRRRDDAPQPAPDQLADVGSGLQQLHVDWQGQLAGWGA